jgi:hypothetical protein
MLATHRQPREDSIVDKSLEKPEKALATRPLERAEFEKKFLALVYESDIAITAPNIARSLDITISEAQEHLLELELNSVIRQETTDSGDSYYVMPNRPAPGSVPAPSSLSAEAGGGGTPRDYNPADLAPAPILHSPGARGKNVNGLVLNVIFPGVGSLVCGKTIGLAMLGLVLLGIIMFFLPLGFGRLLGLLPIAGGWIWSIIAGVGLLSEKEPPPGIPT